MKTIYMDQSTANQQLCQKRHSRKMFYLHYCQKNMEIHLRYTAMVRQEKMQFEKCREKTCNMQLCMGAFKTAIYYTSIRAGTDSDNWGRLRSACAVIGKIREKHIISTEIEA